MKSHENVSAVLMKKKIMKMLQIKNLRIKLKVLENNRQKVKILVSYTKNDFINLTFRRELQFFR